MAAIKVIFSTKGNSFNGNEFSPFCVYYFSPNGVDKDIAFLLHSPKRIIDFFSRAVVVKNDYFSSNQVASFFFYFCCPLNFTVLFIFLPITDNDYSIFVQKINEISKPSWHCFPVCF